MRITKVYDVDNTNRFKSLNRKNLEAAAVAIGALVLAEIKARTPVDTGFLRRSNQYEIESIANQLAIIFFNDASYAQYIELGTYKTDAQPYMGPAIDEAQQIVETVVINHLRRGTI